MIESHQAVIWFILHIQQWEGVICMSLIIGLTGSIASGKSTVSEMFTRLDIPVVDADRISRDVVKPGENAYRQIINQFGEDLLLTSKEINREKLGAIIFADEDKRKQLNNIVHPAIRQEMVRQRDQYLTDGAHCVVLDIPLLYENKLTHFVEKTMVVYVDEAVQIKRLMERNDYTKEEALQRIHAQMPVKEKATLADAVINNNGTKSSSFDQLLDILKRWNVF